MSDLPQSAIGAHYERVRGVYEALADVDGYPTLAVPDFTGWYVRRDTDDVDAIERGFTRKGRVTDLSRDLDSVLGQLDRVMYTVTSYKRPGSLRNWVHCDGTDWDGDKPTPEYADIVAFPAWGDIDLADHLKSERGQLDVETKATVEETLAAYVDAYAELYGSRDAVYALDSVGGAYIFGAPEATLPIAEYYEGDRETLERVFEAFADRSNEWLAERETEINAEIDGAAETIQPDWVNNRNRQYKAPLSLHKNHDAVVTPIDTDDVAYDYTHIDMVDDDLVDAAESWAASFTAREHTECVETLVANLWPEYYDAEGDWQAALDAWVAEQEQAEQERQERRERAVQRRQERREEYGDIEGQPVTPHLQDVYDAIDDLDIKRVAEDTVVHEWTEDATGKTSAAGDNKKDFVPAWDPSAGGTANYIDLQQGTWVDTGTSGDYGTAVEMALIAEEAWTRGEIAEGEDWFRGVEILREKGYNIPVWTPDTTTEREDCETYDKMPLWSLRRAAVALSVCPPDAFIERESDDGGTYEGFPGRQTYENALEAAEDAGLKHGRKTPAERQAVKTLESLQSRLERAKAEGEDADDELEARDWGRLYEAVGELAEEDEHLIEEIANLADESEVGLNRHRDLYQYQQEHGDVKPEDNKLKLISGTRRKAETLLNFDMDVESFLSLEDGQYMANVGVTPAEEPGNDFEKQIEPKMFNRPQRFKDEILAERFSTTIEADEMPDEDVLDHVRKFIHRQDAPKLAGTKQMGLKDGQVVTPNGVITSDGWNKDSNVVFVERDVGAERKFTLSPSTNDDVDRDEVAEMLELFSNTRSSEELLPVLGWFYAAPLRPHVMDVAGSFNLLSVEGDSGTGKTGTLGTLWQMFGMCDNGAEPFSCNDTPFSVMTTLASSRGVPMWFDEYKPSDMSEYQSQRLHDFLKKAATGGTEQRGNPDQTTEEYHLRAPVVLSGEEGMMGAAEKRRAVQTTFKHAPTQEGSPEYRRFKQLVGDAYVDDGEVQFEAGAGKDLRMHALAYYEFIARLSKSAFEENWRQAKVDVEDKIHDWDMTDDLDDLEKQGLQTVVFGYRIFRQFAEAMGADMDALPGEAELETALKQVADVGGPGRESHLDRYVQLLSRVTLDGRLEEGEQYKVVNEGGPDEELRVNVTRAHDKVTQYARDHDITEDLLAQAKDYKSRFKEAEERDGTYVVNYSQNTPPISRCVGIDMELAEAELEDFSRNVFTSSVPDIDATPLSQVDSGEMVDVTAECVQVYTEDSTSPWLEQEGFVRDETGWVMFQLREDNPDAYLDEGTAYRIENAMAREDSDGVTYIEIVPNMTEIEEIEMGDGHTDPDGHGWMDQSSPTTDANETTDQDAAATDGGAVEVGPDDQPPVDATDSDVETDDSDEKQGHRGDAETLAKMLKNHKDAHMTEAKVIATASQKHDMKPDRVRETIPYAIQNGYIIKESDGYREN